MLRILHLITGLAPAGAENVLYRLLSRVDRDVFSCQVVSLGGRGVLADKIEALGIPVRALDLNRTAPNPLTLLRWALELRRDPPHVLAAWMYHANFAGSLLRPLAGSPELLWSLHHGHPDPAIERRRTVLLARAGARLSYGPVRAIVCCGETCRRAHLELGYAPEKLTVIRNGFDTRVFRPDEARRREMRARLGIREEQPLVGHVARFHAEKDHRTFFQAAARLKTVLPSVRFLLCGWGMEASNPVLAGWIRETGLEQSCLLLGVRQDMPELYPALDLLCSSSVTEAFPLVLGEAMASGVPCVATDVGDSAELVGALGLTVPPRDPEALAEACRTLLELAPPQRRNLGQAARRRIVSHFDLSSMVQRYEALWSCRGSAPSRSRFGPKPHAETEARP